MDSQVHVFPRENGEIQRVQAISFSDWDQLDFLFPKASDQAFSRFCDIYRQYLVPGCPWIFGNLLLFSVPDGLSVPFPCSSNRYGDLCDRLTCAAIALKEGVRVRGGQLRFKNNAVKAFCCALQEQGCLQLVKGKLPITTVIPVGNRAGFLSQHEPNAKIKVNSSFFIMDPFDCATVYDHIGTPIGLMVKDGDILNPPLFQREALIVRKDGQISVEAPDIRTIPMEIGGRRYLHGENAVVYTRPERARTPAQKGAKLVIVGCKVVAVSHRKSVHIPASGFVLCVGDDCKVSPGDPVIYRGMENVRFGIQVGNSAVRAGKPTVKFISRFYNIRRLERIPFPPCLYPMDFARARAARVVLGADSRGKPMLLWAEGAAKLGHTPGKDSCGASLLEMAQICDQLGMVNGVHLDGGGSAQILFNGQRQLTVCDRNADDHSEEERSIPVGLIVR